MAWCTLVQMGNLSECAGLSYNNMFSVDLPLFDSKVFTHKKGVDVRNKGIGQGHYLFGIDSVWHGATNELIVMMTFKMKHSVLFGVVRMIVGMLLGCSKTFIVQSRLDFICECFHMLSFMVCLSGWMVFMVL